MSEKLEDLDPGNSPELDTWHPVLLNPIPYGLRPTPIPYGGGTILPPLSKIPESGRLGLNLWIYTKCGLKFQKNPNQFHINS